MLSDQVQPERARRFALWIVHKLHEAGFQALWAGGCVRDELLGVIPNDYDVATNALPDEVRRCFGRRRTLAIGEAFGVITVVGNREEGQIEVATFRCDAAYSDGRRPDSVSFSTAQEDAQHRDFTINGMFFDPLTNQVIDYVGGRQDLAVRVVRAIGDPLERFAEDKLRMLRAARLAATFDFDVDRATLAAIQAQAPTITLVSAERVATEMRKILVHRHRAHGVRLLREMRLLDVLVPEYRAVWEDGPADASDAPDASDASDAAGNTRPGPTWTTAQAILHALPDPSVRVGLAAFLWPLHEQHAQRPSIAEVIGERWRLSTDERQGAGWLLAHARLIRRASTLHWPRLQRVLTSPAIEELLMLAEAIAREVDGQVAEIDYCRGKLQLPPAELNPPLLIGGDDLRAAGYQPGPRFREVLGQVRDAQLEAQIHSRDEALALARTLFEPDK